MKKLATPQDLQAELGQLLSHCQGQEELSRGRVAATLNSMADRLEGTSKTARDSEEEALYDAIWMRATNDGDSYRKRDAAGAVTKGWLEWQKDEGQRNRENWRGIKRDLVKDLTAYWERGGAGT